MNSAEALGALTLFEREIIEFKNVIEIVSLCAHQKSVVRLVIPENKINAVTHILSTYFKEYHYSLAPYALINVSFGSVTTNSGAIDRFQKRVGIENSFGGDRVIFFGTDSGVNQALQMESGECNNLEAGSIYGYPSCCSLSYESIEREKSWIAACLGNVLGTIHLPAIANRFSTLIGTQLGVHLDYFPCSIECQETISINKANRKCLALSPLACFIKPINEHTNATIIWWKGCLWYIKGALSQNTEIFFRHLKPDIFSSSISSYPTIEGLSYRENNAEVLVGGKWLSGDGENSPRIILFGGR
jgi:hypothetical protein